VHQSGAQLANPSRRSCSRDFGFVVPFAVPVPFVLQPVALVDRRFLGGIGCCLGGLGALELHPLVHRIVHADRLGIGGFESQSRSGFISARMSLRLRRRTDVPVGRLHPFVLRSSRPDSDSLRAPLLSSRREAFELTGDLIEPLFQLREFRVYTLLRLGQCFGSTP